MDVIADRYELGRALGAGGMARVVEAHDRLLDRKVAVKLLRDDATIDAAVRERFLREARTAARFNHPNAVAVYDTGREGSQPWIVMELVHGEDLAQRLAREGALVEEDAVRITDGVLSALAAAHATGMVHRDVKPGNIMLLHDGSVKLADFGIAKSLQDATAGLTSTGQVIGTAKYLSPEQVEGQPASPASDVYAVGVVLYEMLTGQPPFTGDTAIAIALAHTRDPVPKLRRVAPHVSPAVAGVVMRALEKDPAGRYADAGEMRRALASGEAGAAAAVPATAVIDRAAPTRVLPADPAGPRRSSMWPLLLGMLALLALLAAAAWLRDADPLDEPQAQRQTPPATQQEEQREQPEETRERPTEPPQTQPPQTQAPLPTDLPSLITFLAAADPDEYGKAQDDLRKGLVEVLEKDGEEQAKKADELQDKTAEWVGKDELDPAIGDLAIQVLEPYTAAEPAPDEQDDDPGQGRGNAKGRDDD